jgi:hypothetical protein
MIKLKKANRRSSILGVDPEVMVNHSINQKASI